MALAKKCDRCGKFYESYGNNSFNAIMQTCKDQYGYRAKKNKEWDLCPECKENLEAWLNGGQ
jgi:hypothetical protein